MIGLGRGQYDAVRISRKFIEWLRRRSFILRSGCPSEYLERRGIGKELSTKWILIRFQVVESL